MKIMHLHLLSIFVTALALTAPNMVLAQGGIEINSANPALGAQGTLALSVTIKGKGFDKTVKQVKFLLHCEPEDTACIANPDPGGITVNSFKVDDAETITASIDISATAVVASFDIAMTTRGRGGKGTTFRSTELFSVKLRGNQTFASCDVFAPYGTCTCTFAKDPVTGIHEMLDDCETSETLWMGEDHRQVWGAGQANQRTLRVVNNANGLFHGSTVIANTDHRAGVKYLNIVFNDDVNRGCADEGEIQSAISFVLDSELPNGEPFPDPGNDAGGPTSLLQVWNTTIDSGFDPLCNAIEIIRTQAYTDSFVDPADELPAVDWKVNVQDSWIKSDSYVETGILYQGIFKWGDNITNPPLIYGNTIGSPACETPDAAIAILIGPTFNLNPVFQVETLVQNNTITMGNTCNGKPESFGTAVLIVGEPTGNQTTTAISNNVISGAFIGVLIDGTVNKANFKGNTLTGNNDATSEDIGICSNVQIGTKGKPNNIQGFSYPIIVGVCPPLSE